MDILSLTPQRYGELFDRFAPHVYNTVAFSEHNGGLADSLRYLAFADGSDRPRLGIILGQRNGKLLSPFSAPFGGFTAVGEQAVEHYCAAAEALRAYGAAERMQICVTLPPDIYAPAHVVRQSVAMAATGDLMYSDISHSRQLAFGPEGPQTLFSVKARNQWRKAAAGGMSFEWSADSREIMERVYAVIEANHSALGYPVRMPLERVISTAPLTGSIFCLVMLDGVDIAAAMINRPSGTVMQVIYWGDLLDYRRLCPMNFLAVESMKLCRDLGATVFDIGPSSEQGIPSAGLCRFKEGLGCTPSLKSTFRL